MIEVCYYSFETWLVSDTSLAGKWSELFSCKKTFLNGRYRPLRNDALHSTQGKYQYFYVISLIPISNNTHKTEMVGTIGLSTYLKLQETKSGWFISSTLILG